MTRALPHPIRMTLCACALALGVLTLAALSAAPAAAMRLDPSATASAAPASSVLSWGSGVFDSLGQGNTTESQVEPTPKPVQLPSGFEATSISVGPDFALAAGSDGQLVGWGDDSYGNLGLGCNQYDGCTVDADQPQQVSLPSGVAASAVAAGGNPNFDFSLMLSAAGTVYGAGDDSDGEVGAITTGVRDDAYTFEQIPLPSGTTATAVAAGADQSYVLTATGSILAFGSDASGELGNGTTGSGGSTPVTVALPAGTTATAVAAGASPCGEQCQAAGTDTAYGLALTSSGTVYEWGDYPGATAPSGTPVAVSFPAGLTPVALAAGGDAYALMSNGTVYAWGANTDESLGSSAPSSATPVEVPLPAGVTATSVAGGALDGYASTSTGGEYGWGLDSSDQLGDGDPGDQIGAGPTSPSFPAGTTVNSVGAGAESGAGFALVAPLPTVYTDPPTAVQASTATLNGGIAIPAGTTVSSLTCSFSYSTSSPPSGGTTVSGMPCSPTAGVTDPFSANIIGLTANTTYYDQASATINGTVVNGPIETFTSGNGITVTTPTATSITNTGAALSGSVTIQSGLYTGSATCTFVYGTDESLVSETSTVSGGPCASSGGTTNLSATLTGLEPNTLYYFRTVATAGGETTQSAIESFTTTGPTPTVTTGVPTNVTATSATFNATVNVPAGSANGTRTCAFQYSQDPLFDPGSYSGADAVCPSSTTGSGAFSVTAFNLTSDVPYYVRALYEVNGQTYMGTAIKFTPGAVATTTTGGATPPPPPPPPTGPAGSAPKPGTANTASLSPTTCSDVTQDISADGGTFEVTGCLYGDNEGQYLVEGTFNLNGLTVTPDTTTAKSGSAATFSCDPSDTACNSLLSTYTGSTKPEFIIDVTNQKVAGNTPYTLATGSSVLFDGTLQSPSGSGVGATFNPTLSGQAGNSGPAIYLAKGAGTHPAALHGFPVEGPIVIFPKSATGSEIQINVSLPFGKVSGSALLQISPTGQENFKGLSVAVPDLSIPGTSIDLSNLSFSFNLDTNIWAAAAGLKLPGLGYELDVSVQFRDDIFNGATGLLTGLDFPIPGTEGLLTLTSIGGGITINPIGLAGTIGLSAGPNILGHSALDITGGFDLQAEGPVTVGPLGDIIPQPITFPNVPFFFALNGSVTIGGEVPLGSVNESILLGPNFTPVITFAGGLGPLGPASSCNTLMPEVTDTCTPQGYALTVKGLTLATVQAQLDAVLLGDHFNAEGLGSVNVLGLSLSGQALISTKGVAACAQLGGSISLANDERTAHAVLATARRTNPATQSFADDVVGGAQPQAVAALAGTSRAAKIKALKADITLDQRQTAALAKATRLQAKAIVKSLHKSATSSGSSALSLIASLNKHFVAAALTQEAAGSDLLSDATTGAGNIQAAGDTASNALQALKQSSSSEVEALAERAEQDETDLFILNDAQAAAAAAGNPIAMDAGVHLPGFIKHGIDDIEHGLDDAFNAVKGICEDAAKDVGKAIASAASTIGGLASSAVAGFEQGLQTFVGDVAQLGKEAEASLEQFATDVKNAAITIADDVANLFNLDIGVGYDWGGKPTFYPTGGCSVGPYVDQTGLNPGSEPDRRAASAAKPYAISPAQVKLTKGPQFTILKFAGNGAPPLVNVTGPQGLSLTTPTTSDIETELGGQAVVIRDPTTDSTTMEFKPATGTYRLSTAAGSVAVTGTQQSTSLPETALTASVTGHGTTRTLHWDATAIAGQTLTFSLEGASGAKTITTTPDATGTASFTVPKSLPGLDTISVEVEEDGFTREGFDVASFQAPVIKPPVRLKGLTISRKGSKVSVNWKPGAADTVGYEVQVTTTGGLSETLSRIAPGVQLSGILPADAVAVQVSAVDAFGEHSSPAVRTLAGLGASGCLAPRYVTLRLKVPGRLRGVVALLGGTPVAANRRGGTTLVIPLGGTIGSKVLLTVKATTLTGRKLEATHRFALCSGHPIPNRLVVTLK